jgi:hypothetical protein
MVKTFSVSLYTCGCGYETTNPGNSGKHKKGKCGHEMTVSSARMVLESDYLEALKTHTGAFTLTGDGNAVDQSNNIDQSLNNTNIVMVLPERSLKEDFKECVMTLQSANRERSAEDIILMPGKLLGITRDPKKLPGALIERNNKIIEKLPCGGERVMGKKKAIPTFTSEGIEGILCYPHMSVPDFLEKHRGTKRTKISLADASRLRIHNPHEYHNKVPDDVKDILLRMENNTETCLQKITTENKDAGFL